MSQVKKPLMNPLCKSFQQDSWRMQQCGQFLRDMQIQQQRQTHFTSEQWKSVGKEPIDRSLLFLFLLWFLWLAAACCHAPLQSPPCFSGSSRRRQWCGLSTCIMNKYNWFPHGTCNLILLLLSSPICRGWWLPLATVPVMLCHVAAAPAGYSCGSSPALGMPNLWSSVFKCVCEGYAFLLFFL